jgi:hypothetical protein
MENFYSKGPLRRNVFLRSSRRIRQMKLAAYLRELRIERPER